MTILEQDTVADNTIWSTFFQLDYHIFHPLITDCWIKSVWCEFTKLDIEVIEGTPILQLK